MSNNFDVYERGDLEPVQHGGAVQARLAANRIKGQAVHLTPGTSIEEWQADILERGRLPGKPRSVFEISRSVGGN